ncbi:dihydropteroate synthase [Agilicoccus flavus]|uniref:dihydropteroate synthase n=1 Tax=Agilicoccus flavus TaxID=2775968 RepID=UPI001CF691DD|nr:dihydropteroate synthase [Agilicoccus flavus]
MTLVMGIVNVTPDSFSDGGRWFDEDAAVAHGLELARQGADLVDVGGESTRPGAARPDVAEETRRVVPVVDRLVQAGLRVSVDTMRTCVARACVERGAVLVNDVSGGLADPDMAGFVADAGVDYVAMHWRGHSADMQSRAVYDDVVADVRRELGERVEELVAAGVARERIVLDPGLGFGKTAEHNWSLLAGLDRLSELGLPLLLGTSRKTFLGRLLAGPDGAPAPPDARDAATAATSVVCAQAGVWCVRVHDVPSTVAALRVVRAVSHAGAGAAAAGGSA